MRVRSTVEVTIRKDRVSEQKGFVEIEIKQIEKDDVSQTYRFKTADKLVVIDENQNETFIPIRQIATEQQEKFYTKTYAEYDAQKEALSQMFPTELTGSEAEDYWLQMGLMYSLTTDPVYGLTGEQWVAV